ncbi:transporter [Microbacteriaceae bacterium K1510]|nr:transporter [Microbacteriaceae bacterium K1510]
MKVALRLALGVCCVAIGAAPSWAAEGSTVAGPIGGTDIRSAFMPTPGLYGAVILGGASTYQLRDGAGQTRPGLDAVGLNSKSAAGVLLYVPRFKVFEGSLGFLGVAGFGSVCGQITSANSERCRSGFGDIYVEGSWSRFFGFTRPSREQGAPPIREGLAVRAGLGTVIPTGLYDARTQASNGVTVGSNTVIVAPSIALTYTTPPLLADGTEFSSKIYLNAYGRNSDTDYVSGKNINVDFAVSEHIGRWQVGVAGYYLRQFTDDTRGGVAVAPDGRRAEVLSLGGVVNYDIPDLGASIKFKARTSVFAYNTAMTTAFYLTIAKKLD